MLTQGGDEFLDALAGVVVGEAERGDRLAVDSEHASAIAGLPGFGECRVYVEWYADVVLEQPVGPPEQDLLPAQFASDTGVSVGDVGDIASLEGALLGQIQDALGVGVVRALLEPRGNLQHPVLVLVLRDCEARHPRTSASQRAGLVEQSQIHARSRLEHVAAACDQS